MYSYLNPRKISNELFQSNVSRAVNRMVQKLVMNLQYYICVPHTVYFKWNSEKYCNSHKNDFGSLTKNRNLQPHLYFKLLKNIANPNSTTIVFLVILINVFGSLISLWQNYFWINDDSIIVRNLYSLIQNWNSSKRFENQIGWKQSSIFNTWFFHYMRFIRM